MDLNNCANNPFYSFLNYIMYIIHHLLNITKISSVLYIYKSGMKSTLKLTRNVELGFQADSQTVVDGHLSRVLSRPTNPNKYTLLSPFFASLLNRFRFRTVI
jgi:hypothetical protein